MTGSSNCLNPVKASARGLASDSFALELTEGEKKRNSQNLKHNHKLVH